ncbi:heat shock 70 kDa protein 12B-like [Mytilus edulis]|uniref:heat shock 70 kDa protein 12B-like n=1 Tax=Mytilus edulis TaxID=6550 RepID=UPI0039F12B4C
MRQKMTEEFGKVNYDLAAAIDIGTSASGYAYSTKTAFSSNPLNIISEQCWNKFGLCKDETERKTASCILFDKEQNFVSFGYDAQHRFAQLQSKNEDANYAFFQHFKMCLYEQQVSVMFNLLPKYKV